jgi:hypothetical protein
LASICAEKPFKQPFHPIYGGALGTQACYWLKQAFYEFRGILRELQRESLTLSDLKKTDVLKFA